MTVEAQRDDEDSPRGKILVVDDAPTVRHFLRLVLAEAGYEDVILAASVAEAREALAHEVDVVFIDKNLEDGDGFAVAREVRARWDHAVRIMMTADQSVETAVQAIEEDVFAYLTKPLRRPEVILKVRRGLDRAALSRERAQARRELQEANRALEQRTLVLQETVDRLVATRGRLVESERLAALGTLAAGVAHEINNPACFILPNLDYLRRGTKKLAEIAARYEGGVESVEPLLEHTGRMLDRCQEGVERIQHVVRTLQIFSRHDRGRTTDIDVDSFCRSLLNLISHELASVAEVSTDLQAQSRVRGKEQEIAQALLNLLLEARRHVAADRDTRGHRIQLSTSSHNGFVRFVIRDTGVLLSRDERRSPEEALATDAPSGPRSSVHDAQLRAAGISVPENKDGDLDLDIHVARDLLGRNGGTLSVRRDPETETNVVEARLPVVADPPSS